MVSGSLALGLDQDGDVLGVLAIPRLEGLEDLETVGGGRDLDLDGGAVLGGSLVGVFTSIVTLGRKTITSGGLELEFLAVSSLQGVGERVEVKVSSNAESDDQVRGGNKGVGGRVAVVTSSEVTVVRGEDGVGLALLDVLAVPLTNARTTGVGKNNTTELLEGLGQTVAGDGSANLEEVLAESIKLKYTQGKSYLLRSRSDEERRLGLQAVLHSVPGNRGRTGHVLVRGVGARTDETGLELLGPVVVLDGLAELGDGGTQIRSEGTVDVRLKLSEVDLNNLVVLGALVLLELLGVEAGKVTNVLTLGSSEVLVHVLVEGEDGGGGTNFSTLRQ